MVGRMRLAKFFFLFKKTYLSIFGDNFFLNSDSENSLPKFQDFQSFLPQSECFSIINDFSAIEALGFFFCAITLVLKQQVGNWLVGLEINRKTTGFGDIA